MKKMILCLFIVVGLVACEGDPGPMGPPGDAIVGQTFEFDNINFQYNSGIWTALVDIPADIEVLPSDAILVYLVQSVPGTNGPVDTYSLIPQEFYTAQGTVEYLYNHTANDVELIIDGNYDLSNLDPSFTDNQIFRFVVVPSDFATNPNVNIQSYEGLLKSGIELQQF